MRAIVLSGGGAKGAYQAGVWKALRQLRIKYDIVTGTSIGALNGMMMVQKDYRKCLKLWKNVSFDKLYDNFGEIKNDKDMYLKYFDNTIKGGLDTNRIKKIIEDNYNPYKLYNSKIKYGVVSYSLTNNDPVYVTKNNTEKEKLPEYILASASCFPVFKPIMVDDEVLIDGGYFDNMPINLAVDLGAEEVIAIDLKAIGIKQKVKNKNIKITYIEPSSQLASFLKFDGDVASQMIKLGYNDTMKAFKKFDGKIYTFKKGTNINNYLKYKDNIDKLIDETSYVGILKNLNNLKNKEEKFNEVIEDALEIFELPLEKIYSYKKYNKLLLLELDKIEDVEIKEFDLEKIKKLLNRKVIVKYIYNKLKKRDKINVVFNLFTKEYTTAIYLLAIRRYL